MGLCNVGTHWLSIYFDTSLGPQALKLLGRVRLGLLLCEPLKHAQYSGSWTIANTLFCYSVEKVQILQRQIFSIKILYFCYFRVEVFWYDVNNVTEDYELLKNQYRPMKKGVANMVKLHATGAVAMPIETRLHILASSKDVIHS